MADKTYDVIIVGGATAGLSAALVLGRSLRKVLVLDAGAPSNRFAERSHNFLTHDGHQPSEIGRVAREQVEAYDTVEIRSDTAVEALDTRDGFKIITQSGAEFMAPKLILATGIEYQFPDLKGYAACWGVSALHCPYCHGYEFKNMPTAVLFDDKFSSHYLGLIRELSQDLVIFTNGVQSIKSARFSRLAELNIKVYTEEIVELKHERGLLQTVVLASGMEVPCKVMYSPRPASYNTSLAKHLGCDLGDAGFVKHDNKYQTNVSGVYVCGDVSGAARSIAVSVASGNIAGISAHESLLSEKFI